MQASRAAGKSPMLRKAAACREDPFAHVGCSLTPSLASLSARPSPSRVICTRRLPAEGGVSPAERGRSSARARRGGRYAGSGTDPRTSRSAPNRAALTRAAGPTSVGTAIDTMLSNFILPLQDLADGTSRIHCSLNLNTETGRLSSRTPNLQNQPALEKDKYLIRDAFVAAPGKALVVADYGQLPLPLQPLMTGHEGGVLLDLDPLDHLHQGEVLVELPHPVIAQQSLLPVKWA